MYAYCWWWEWLQYNRVLPRGCWTHISLFWFGAVNCFWSNWEKNQGFNPWVGKIPWRGDGNLLQYSCLENLMDRGAWRASVHVVPKSQTRLSVHIHAHTENSQGELNVWIQPVHPKGNQSWIFTGRTHAEAETPKLWPPDAKNWLIGKDPDPGKDWRQEEKGMTEDELLGWHHWLNGHEFEQALGVGDGQGGLVCCSSWGHKELDTTEWLNWTERVDDEIMSVMPGQAAWMKAPTWFQQRERATEQTYYMANAV